MILRWIAVIGGVLLFWVIATMLAAPSPEKSEPELCDGLTPLQCHEAKLLEQRRNEMVRQMEALDAAAE